MLLRTGALQWPHGWARLSVPLATVNTIVLISSSVTMAMAVAALRRKNLARGRACVLATIGLAATFMIVKLLEYREHFGAGELPSRDNFFATYYTLTGLHAVHVAGGILVMTYLAGPGAGLWSRAPERYTHRVETAALYWYFVDLVWIVLFPVLYLS